ncbi:MAG TPA: diguanylate cyclase [Caldimonas sp.]|jgi:diguanylate cyclase (GGDEF)-like protein/PAS domain S-box-containing protein|nr:diguanylate cyclase [Caldimonas sp.]HEX4234386.1 diguanylate cyclase [Caldimonas sp.]
MGPESGFAVLADGGLPTAPPAPADAPATAAAWPLAARPAVEDETEARFARQFTTEWLALLFGLVVFGLIIAWSLFRAHALLDATERDRLRVQARVVDDNVGQQLEGINHALAVVGDEFLETPVHSVSTLLSVRMKALSDAIPGVRSMALLDSDGNVVASSVDALLGRDFANRDYFRAARDGDAQTLYVAPPLKTPLDTYTVIFVRGVHARDGSFAGAVAAALEPDYFRVLLRSVLYAPDMRVSLGHGDGKVFVTMPEDPRRIESQPTFAAIGRLRGGIDEPQIMLGPIGGSNEARMTALSRISPPALHMDKPLVIAVSRAVPDLFAPWRQQAFANLTFFALLGAGAAFGLYRGQWRRKSYALLEASAERERRKNAEQLELALEGADLGLWDWDVRNDRFTSNELVRRQLGYAPGELGDSGAAWRNLVHRDEAERLISSIEAHFRRETAAYECEFRVRHKDGRWVWLLSRGKVVERDGDDTPVRMAGTHMDLTRRIRIEAESRRTTEMLRRTGELASIGGWELDLATMQVEWSEQVFRIHELPSGPSPRLEDTMQYYGAGRPALQTAIEAAAREGTPWDLELPFVTAKGTARWLRAQGAAVCEDGRPVRLLGAFQDITEKKKNALELHRLNEELTRLSTTDALTEIGNRRLFDQTLRAEWARAARRGGSIGLLMIDVDHFKEYNDHYGHPAGDTVLRQIAHMVGDSVRRGGELVARYGGEEFALLLPGADLEAAIVVAERCRQQVIDAKIEHRASATSAWLGVSIGVASQVASPAVDCSVLVEIADAALYRAKRCGRGRIEF